jgi:hypothetical protein
MAGAGFKTFNTGDVLTAADVNTYLQQQVTMVFASAAARTTALSGVLAEGMMSYLQDTNSVEVYNGSSWVNVGNAGDITEVQAGTGISVASGTGPIPVVTNTVATTFDAKGDLVVGTGADTFAKLSVGTNGHTLVADSSTSTGLAYSAGILVVLNAQTATYTTVLADAFKLVTMSVSSANNFQIPTNASVAYPVGTVINVIQIGTGQTTIQAVTSGTTTISSTGATATAPKLRAQYSAASCIKVATDTWYVVGDIA